MEQNHQLVHLSAKFDRDTPDVIWITRLGREGNWVIISGDPRITRGREERRAWRESGLTAFFFGGKFASSKIWKQASVFCEWWPRIAQEAREYREGELGCGYIIPPGGKKWTIHTPTRHS